MRAFAADPDDLVAAAVAGDDQAFGRLVAHVQERMLRLAASRTHDGAAAADCVQIAMLAAWQAMPRFQGNADDFAGWLSCIVLNVCADRGRYDRRRPTEPLDAGADNLDGGAGSEVERSLPDPSPSPEEMAIALETSAVLVRAVDRLGADHRCVVELDLEGLSYREIASRTGVPVGTVRSRLSRARGRLRSTLAAEPALRALGVRLQCSSRPERASLG
jgi:RNA polymerase sigma-70 factor (ECF subfamily)